MKRAIKLPLVVMALAQFAGVAVAADNVTPINGDIFDKPPAAAKADPASACSVPKRYVDLMNAWRFDEVGSLFADNAVFVAPNGKVFVGAQAIQKFYSGFLPTVRGQLVPLSFINDKRECVMELAHRRSDKEPFRLGAIDHFTINDAGKVERLVVFIRPSSLPPSDAK